MTATTTRAAETWAHLLRCQREGVPAFPWALDFAQDGGDDLDRVCAAVEVVAQQHLDAHPDDHAARRLLGEWLTACGDARGEGYVALARFKRVPLHRCIESTFLWREDWQGCTAANDRLHSDWWCQLRTNQREVKTRAGSENAAAKAFLRLPESRRAALLKGEM